MKDTELEYLPVGEPETHRCSQFQSVHSSPSSGQSHAALKAGVPSLCRICAGQ